MSLRDKVKRNKENRSLSLTLVISFLSFSLALLIISGFLGAFFSFQTQQSIIFSQQQLIAQNAANAVAGFMQEKLSALETTASLINPAIMQQNEQNRYLNRLLGSHPAFRQLVLLDSKKQKLEGISRLTQERFNEFNNRFGNDLFNLTSGNKKYISSVYVDKVSSEPIIIMAVPVKDIFGDLQGFLIAEVNLKFMWDLVDSMKVGRTGLAYVADKKGKLIAFSDISRVLRDENVENVKVVREFIENSINTNEARAEVFKGINGTSVVGTYVSLGVPDWAVVTEMPVSEAYTAVFQNILSMAILTILMSVLAVWIGIYLARRLSSPLISLMKTASRISKGEMELKVEVEGPLEISNLAETFNSMTAQLRTVIESLEQRGRYLQEMVQKYVDFMDGVGKGRLDSKLTLDDLGSGMDDPLIILGHQLNDTAANLKQTIDQIQDAAAKIKRKDERLQLYAEKVKKSNDELEQFAFIASHDLQEPLRKIKTFGERLKEKHFLNQDEQGRDYIDRIMNASARMQVLIEDLLKYSRITTQAEPYASIDLKKIITDVVSDLEIRLEKTSGKIEIGLLPVIDADPTQMRQLFQNLIGNALKFHKHQEAPIIKIYQLQETQNKFYRIIVEDNGIGIDKKYYDKIFEVFQRLHGRSEYEGSGIGLAVCKKIVERHGGTIQVESKVGEGAKFIINLPLKQIKEGSPEKLL